MRLIDEAWTELRKQLGDVILFIGLSTLVTLSKRSLDLLLAIDPETGADAPGWVPVYIVVSAIALAAGAAAAQAVCFARFGRMMDRPLWKCRDDAEALLRFFMLWFLVNLAGVAIARITVVAGTNDIEELAQFGFLLYLVWLLVAVPAGACIMFWGRLDWAAVPEALTPFFRMMPLSLVILFLNLFQFSLGMVRIGAAPGDTWPQAVQLLANTVLDLPFPFLDCVAFAATWRVCMIHRDLDLTADSDDDYDF